MQRPIARNSQLNHGGGEREREQEAPGGQGEAGRVRESVEDDKAAVGKAAESELCGILRSSGAAEGVVVAAGSD